MNKYPYLIHIRRDGANLCRHKSTKWFGRYQHMSFSEAHKVDFTKPTELGKSYCSHCVEKYYNLIKDKLIIVK